MAAKETSPALRAPSPEGRDLLRDIDYFLRFCGHLGKVVQRVASPLEKLPEGLMRFLLSQMQ
jgi:hypothetical protein